MPSLIERLERFSLPDTETGCLLWIGGRFADQYGCLRVNGKARRVHRIAYELAYGEISSELNVCHRCDNKLCIESTHLFLGTHGENVADRHIKGRDARGEKHGRVKLTTDNVRTIRNRVECGISKTQLAYEFGVDSSLIRQIVNRKIWTHI